jgi:hypothetical protein
MEISMLTRLVTILTVGTILMGSSRVITPPIYVHCIADDAQIERTVCTELVRNLRARNLNRAIAKPPKESPITGAGIHLTLHVLDDGNATVKSYLSWKDTNNSVDAVQKHGSEIEVTRAQMLSNVKGMIDALVSDSGLPL